MSNRERGNVLEREVVAWAKENGLDAKRAWCSDGRAMGEAQDVDVLVWSDKPGFLRQWKIQCRRSRKPLPRYMQPAERDDWSRLESSKGRGAWLFMSMDTWLSGKSPGTRPTEFKMPDLGAKWRPPESCHLTVCRRDRGPLVAVVREGDWLTR